MDVQLWNSIWGVLETFIPTVEGFVDHPYWDVKQWTWGYGTRVPGSVGDKSKNPGGKITKAEALMEQKNHLVTDFVVLSKVIHTPLKVGQWAALLSFAYQEGTGAAVRLVPDIMLGDLARFEAHFMKYVYVDGKEDEGTKSRRRKEMLMWKL